MAVTRPERDLAADAAALTHFGAHIAEAFETAGAIQATRTYAARCAIPAPTSGEVIGYGEGEGRAAAIIAARRDVLRQLRDHYARTVTVHLDPASLRGSMMVSRPGRAPVPLEQAERLFA